MKTEKEEKKMCLVWVHALCDKRFSEFLSDETSTELAVEEVMSQVLLALFGEGSVDEVTVHSSAPLRPGLPNCSIHIRAQSPCHCFTLFPRNGENMERAIENSLSALLRELFLSVDVEKVTLSHEPWDYGDGPLFSYQVAL